MKMKSYKVLFRFFSYLADKTNGASFFVNYKLILGTLIIGLTGASCNKATEVSKPKNAEPASRVVRAVKRNIRTLKKRESNQQPVFTPPVIRRDDIDDSEPFITCYVPVHLEEDNKQQPKSEPFIYGMIEVPPISPEGDLEQFRNWVHQNIQYPESMLLEKIQGRTIVNFIIDEKGKLTHVNIIRSINPDANDEVLRILSMSRLWTPGEVDGQKIKTIVTLPIVFRLPQN